MLFSRPLSLLATTILLSTPVVHALLSSTGEKFLPSGAAALSVNFKVSGSQEELKLDVDGKTTIADLKTHIAEKSGTLAADGLKIIFKGRILKDADTVEGSGITSGVTCHVVKSTPSAKAPAPVSGSAEAEAMEISSPGNGGGQSFPAGGIPMMAGSGSPAAMAGAMGDPAMMQMMQDPAMMQMMQGMMGGGNGGMGSPAGMEGMMQNMMQNPEMMENLMQSPMMQNMMQQMADNPEMMRQMMSQNPMLQSMMRENPMAAQMMQDPAMLRMMLNPQMMQMSMQMMRNQAQGGASMGGTPMPPAGGMSGAPPTTMPPTGETPSAIPFPAPGAMAQTGGMGGAPGTMAPTGTMGGAPGGDAMMQMMQNPAMMQMIQQMMSGGAPGGNMGGVPAPGMMGGGMPGMMGGGMPGAAATPGPLVGDPTQNYETVYATQLAQLKDMGFTCEHSNLQAIVAARGDMQAAINSLLSTGAPGNYGCG